jgi:DNA-directed RNA polymerase subunit F
MDASNNTIIEDNYIKPQELEEFLSLMKLNIESKSIKLTVAQKNWISAFINLSPYAIKQILEEINNIKTEIIHIHDIPKIINNLSTIYRNASIQINFANSDNLIILIKITLDVLIEYKYIPLPEVEKRNIETIVNASLDLLKQNIKIVKKNSSSCFSFFFPKKNKNCYGRVFWSKREPNTIEKIVEYHTF